MSRQATGRSVINGISCPYWAPPASGNDGVSYPRSVGRYPWRMLAGWRSSRQGTAPASAVRRLQEGVRRDSRLALLPLVPLFCATVSDLACRRLILSGLLSGRWVADFRFLPLERQPPIVGSFSPLRLFGCPTRNRKSVSRNKATVLLYGPCLRQARHTGPVSPLVSKPMPLNVPPE